MDDETKKLVNENKKLSDDFIATPSISSSIDFKNNFFLDPQGLQKRLEEGSFDLYLRDKDNLYFSIESDRVTLIKLSEKMMNDSPIKNYLNIKLFIGRPFRVVKFKNTNTFFLYWKFMDEINLLKGKPLEIYKELEKRGFVVYNKAKELFFEFLYALITQKYALIFDEELLYGDGIFYDDKLLVSNFKGYPYLQPTDNIGNVQYSLHVLNELSDYFKKSIFKTIITYTIASAFSFVIRKHIQPFPFLILQGRKRMGKTTLVRLAISIWYGDSFKGEKNPMTPAQFHSAVSETTLPVVLNDIDKLIGEEPKITQELKNIFENIELKEYAHTKEKFYSLSMPLFTTNKLIPLDPAIRRRTYILQLTEDLRRHQEIWEIDKPEKKFKYLNIIGRYVLFLVKKGEITIDMLKKDPLKIGEEILLKIYKDAKMDIPDWLKENFEYATFEELEEEDEQNAIELVKEVLKKEIKPREFSKSDIITAIKQGKYTTYSEVLGDNGEGEIWVSTSILRELDKVGISNLKDLEVLLRDYNAERKKKGKKRRWYLVFSYSDFLDLMGW